MTNSMCTRSLAAVLTLLLGIGLMGCPSPAPPPKLPPPEYEAPRDLDVPTAQQDEGELVPLPEPSAVPTEPTEEDAGVEERAEDAAASD